MSKRENWVWMPHPGHFICSKDCQFHLNTYVGGYIVSTVGEYWPDQSIRRIHAEIHDPVWCANHRQERGDTFDAHYMNHFGFEELGGGRTFETMVFKATREKDPAQLCCPWTMESGDNIDFDGYVDRVSAYKGHLALCKKWAAKA